MNNLVRMKQNYSKALGMIRRGARVKFDPNLSEYLKLTPDEIQGLRSHYGDEQVEQYVIDMERKREAGNG